MAFKPFTYLIGWKEFDKWYYGVRFARNCQPDDLWTKYFTSSKHVQEFRKEHGEPDVIEIRQTFNDSLQAREWEHKVLRRLKVIQNDKWLNLGTGRAIPPHYGPQSKEWVEKRVKSKKGYTHSEETKRKIGEKAKERHPSEETRRKIGEKSKGRPGWLAGGHHSEETKRKMSLKKKGEGNPMYGKKQPIDICHYCGKTASKTNIKKWHNENCKIKEMCNGRV